MIRRYPTVMSARNRTVLHEQRCPELAPTPKHEAAEKSLLRTWHQSSIPRNAELARVENRISIPRPRCIHRDGDAHSSDAFIRAGSEYRTLSAVASGMTLRGFASSFIAGTSNCLGDLIPFSVPLDS